MSPRVLLVGWFSFDGMGATAGDVLAADTAEAWLQDAGIAVDRAVAPPWSDGLRWEDADPRSYSHVVFVCGPLRPIGLPLSGFLDRFGAIPFIGLDVTVACPLSEWNPYEVLFERDGTGTTRPDLAWVAPRVKLPLVGIVLARRQPEYGRRGRHREAAAAIEEAAGAGSFVRLPIDTRLDENRCSLRNAAEVESLIGACDAVLTSRLHGLVLSLRNGVPAVAVDPVAGGGKLTAQAEKVRWPAVFSFDSPSPALSAALAWCLTPSAKAAVQECAARASAELATLRNAFTGALRCEEAF